MFIQPNFSGAVNLKGVSYATADALVERLRNDPKFNKEVRTVGSSEDYEYVRIFSAEDLDYINAGESFRAQMGNYDYCHDGNSFPETPYGKLMNLFNDILDRARKVTVSEREVNDNQLNDEVYERVKQLLSIDRDLY